MVGNSSQLKSESFAIPFQLWHEFLRRPKAGTFISLGLSLPSVKLG